MNGVNGEKIKYNHEKHLIIKNSWFADPKDCGIMNQDLE